MKQMIQKQEMRGVTAVEVVIGVSIAALVLIFSMNAIVQFVNTGRTVGEKTKALYLAEEGLEMVRFIRDGSWSTISALPLTTTRYLAVSGTSIGVTTTPEVVGGYQRSFMVSNVYRNSTTDDIVASTTGGSVADAESKYVTVTVSGGVPTTTVSLSTIITNLDP